MSKRSVFLRRLLVLFSTVCLVCVTVAFAGCEKEEEEQISSLTYSRLDSVKKQLSYRTDSMVQTTCSIAYENGWLTETDVAHAMYYACGKVVACSKSDWENKNEEAYKEIDFTPEDQCPALNERVELDIKRSVYENSPVSKAPEVGYEEFAVTFEEFVKHYSFRFVGSYNGTFVLTDEETTYWSYGQNIPPAQWIAGYVWHRSHGKDLFVFRYE